MSCQSQNSWTYDTVYISTSGIDRKIRKTFHKSKLHDLFPEYDFSNLMSNFNSAIDDF